MADEIHDGDEVPIDEIVREFDVASQEWADALLAHSLAPPNDDFAARLRRTSVAATRHANICLAAHRRGLKWTPVTDEPPPIPYELAYGSGRRGPAPLWKVFDNAAEELGATSTGRSARAVAAAFTDIALAAEDLADAVEAEDAERRKTAEQNERDALTARRARAQRRAEAS